VARLVPVKGVLDLMRAAQELVPMVPDFHMAIAGEGPQRGEIERFLGEQDLRSRVTLLGECHDVPTLLSTLDVLAVPSHNEGMGRVAVEGMAAGLPIVATRVGGLQDLVQNGQTGLLVPPHDPPALAGALARLRNDPQEARRMGQQAAQRASLFSLEHMLESLDRLYAGLGVAPGSP
jgi:glycosyltransferase involved in cell wall biosynthesis